MKNFFLGTYLTTGEVEVRSAEPCSSPECQLEQEPLLRPQVEEVDSGQRKLDSRLSPAK